jgi:hypothetical protein
MKMTIDQTIASAAMFSRIKKDRRCGYTEQNLLIKGPIKNPIITKELSSNEATCGATPWPLTKNG